MFFQNHTNRNSSLSSKYTDAYRYGFNGTEGDQEMYNNKASHDFGARMYNSDLGRFFSADPYESYFSFISPYTYTQNNPIRFVDLGGFATGDPIKAKLTEGCQSLIVVLKDGPDDYNTKELENSSWDYIIVEDIRDAANYLKKNAPSGYDLKNIELITHGGEIVKNPNSEDEVTIGYGISLHDKNYYFEGQIVVDECIESISYVNKTNLQSTTIKNYLSDKSLSDDENRALFLKETCQALATIGSYLSDGGNFVFGGCNLGQNKNFDNTIIEDYGKLLLSKNNSCKNLNLYVNNDFTSTRRGDIYSQNRKVILNEGLIQDKNYNEGFDEYKIKDGTYKGINRTLLQISLLSWPGMFNISKKEPPSKPQFDQPAHKPPK